MRIKINGVGMDISSKKQLSKVADETKLSREDLQAIYDSIPGLPAVKRLRNRVYAIERIWELGNKESPGARRVPVSVPPLGLPESTGNRIRHRAPTPQGDTKRDRLISALKSGATISELVAISGWLEHSIRGFLSTMSRNGTIALSKTKLDGVTRYRAA